MEMAVKLNLSAIIEGLGSRWAVNNYQFLIRLLRGFLRNDQIMYQFVSHIPNHA